MTAAAHGCIPEDFHKSAWLLRRQLQNMPLGVDRAAVEQDWAAAVLELMAAGPPIETGKKVRGAGSQPEATKYNAATRLAARKRAEVAHRARQQLKVEGNWRDREAKAVFARKHGYDRVGAMNNAFSKYGLTRHDRE